MHDTATQFLNEFGTTDTAIGVCHAIIRFLCWCSCNLNSNCFALNDSIQCFFFVQDATAEIMITTLGKIPNEMYYLEDTTPSGRATELHTALNNFSVETTLVPVGTDKFDGYTGYSMLLSILLSVLLIILLLCCITACIIARSKSKHSFFAKNDIECSPGCSGVNVPLLGLEKTSSTTTKTSSMK